MPQSLDNLSTTWNSAGTTYNGIRLSVTDTASAAGSNLLELRGGAAGTTTRFAVDKNGSATFANTGGTMTIGTTGLDVGTFGILRIASAQFGPTSDTILTRDAANTLAQRNGTNAQAFRIYNTFTDASNYERVSMRWNSNVFEIGTEFAGSGVARGIFINVSTEIRLGGAGGSTIYFTPGNTPGFRMDASANFYPSSNNTLSVGRSTNRVANYYVGTTVDFGEAANIVAGTTTGTKIGTATTQKLAFYNATPVVQPTAVADATDAATVITQLNALLSRMRDVGLIAT